MPAPYRAAPPLGVDVARKKGSGNTVASEVAAAAAAAAAETAENADAKAAAKAAAMALYVLVAQRVPQV